LLVDQLIELRRTVAVSVSFRTDTTTRMVWSGSIEAVRHDGEADGCLGMIFGKPLNGVDQLELAAILTISNGR